jgi:hypothetical protein
MANKEINKLVDRLRRSGADAVLRGHRWRITQPGRPLAWLPTSAAGGRGGHSLGNKLAELRAKGYDV